MAATAKKPNGFEQDATNIYAEGLDLLTMKHCDYGPYNISRSPGGPLLGLSVRLHDKVARLAHVMTTGQPPRNESVRDTLLDIMNYGAIGVMVVDGKWPST